MLTAVSRWPRERAAPLSARQVHVRALFTDGTPALLALQSASTALAAEGPEKKMAIRAASA